ncbi:MAG: hypothetical protein K0Q95_2688 [Bacteroidota bacterium]|nr:hypothetical protein [Bacteroidota bacterium]
MKKKFGILSAIVAVLFSACSTDLDVTGDWKETMVVYGLLDQSQTKQYIKINKAFLGKGNAFEYAQIKDSVQFANTLSVTLVRTHPNGTTKSFQLNPDNSIPKNPGTFYSGSQGSAIYSVNTYENGQNQFLDETSSQSGNYTYKLIVHNEETGNEVTANTQLVGDFGNLISPAASASVASLVSTGNNNYRYAITFNTAPKARVYQVVLRLNYIDSLISGGWKNDSIDWNLGEKTTNTLDGGEQLDFGFKGMDYMAFLGSTIGTYSDLDHRSAGKLKIIVISAADDLNTFINVNKPSTGIIQEKPEFTNITNGLGIFSARMTKIPFDHILAANTLTELSGGDFTACLKFYGPGGTWLGSTKCN